MTNVILHLGGNLQRLEKTADLAWQHPTAKAIISSELPRAEVIRQLQLHGISLDRCHLDYQAWDTVTNFTKTLPIMRTLNAQRVFVVTDLFHMRRAMTIARAVYFLRGIKPIACPYMGGDLSRIEPNELVVNNALRAWCWRLTGWLFYDRETYEQRMPAYRAAELER
jgi:uncharacterized SAM-binding protein YcdF (DUF218 family)